MFKPPVYSTITDTALDSYEINPSLPCKTPKPKNSKKGTAAKKPRATTKKVVRYKPLVEYPEPSDVRISTISAVSFLNADIDFPLLYQRLKLVPQDGDETGVFTIKHYTKDPDTKRIVQAVRTKTTETGDVEVLKEVEKHFQNQVTIIWKFRAATGDMKTTNGFIFTNGKVKGVGLKCNEDIALSFEALRRFVEEQLATLGDACALVDDRGLDEDGHVVGISEEIAHVLKKHRDEPHSTDSNSPAGCTKASPTPVTPLWLYGTRATMYNTDYSANFQIIREELFRIILDECHLEESEFEPDIYPAVKIKFAWNYDYLHTPRAADCVPGMCYCTKRCSGKGCGQGDGECKVVTVCVFGNDAPKRHDAKIIITGANSYRQVQEVYTYMNKVLQKHYKEVFYREPYLEKVPVVAEDATD